ncbi:MAG: response regulator transcription factor [Propionibacteriaceae bacterium]|jgi:DNA-binding NarL/FixJ family response regulator|nr:response regulator transcription factor [Propionibacteriaceae bacterium]
MSDPIRILLVDDQELVRAGLAMVIGSQPDMRVVAQAGDGQAAVELARKTPCDIVLMDVRMPGLNGIEATERILADADRRPGPSDGPRVVVLTTYDLDEYLLSAIKAGASGFLLKNSPPEDLLHAIRTVHTGEAVIAPSSTKRLLEHVATAGSLLLAPDPRLDTLTEREREVLVLVAKGLSNSEISQQLYLSETTVKTHIRHLLAKLDARDRVQAVVFAYESGLVSPG